MRPVGRWFAQLARDVHPRIVSLMPKALCMTGLFIAILILVLSLLDLFGPLSIAPLRKASPMMDIVFAICAAALGYLSWETRREQD